MTVAELIAQLQQVPQDALVVVDGYEGGYDPAYPPRPVVVQRASEQMSYMGDYMSADKPDDSEWRQGEGPRIAAVLISRRDP